MRNLVVSDRPFLARNASKDGGAATPERINPSGSNLLTSAEE